MQARLAFMAVLAACAVSAAGALAAQENEACADIPHILQVEALADGGLLVLTTEKGGLYLGARGGRDWRRSDGLADVFIHRAAVHPDGSLYLATSEGLFRSPTGNGGWERVLPGALALIEIEADGSRALAKVWGKGVFVLQLREAGPDSVAEAGEAAGRERSARGTEGVPIDQTLRDSLLPGRGRLADRPVLCAAMTAAGIWLAGTFSSGVVAARPEGTDWEPCSAGLPGAPVLSLAAAPWETVYAGTYGAGLFARNPGDGAWSPAGPLPEGACVEDLAFGPGGEIAAATRGHGVFFSPDRGRTWRPTADIVPGASVSGVAVDRDGLLWAGLWDRGLHVSADRGASWRHVPFAGVAHVADLVFGADGAGYAVLAGLGLVRTRDDGRGWQRVKVPVRPARSLRLALDGSGRLFLGSSEDGLWVSADGGESWARDTRGLPAGGVHDVAFSPGRVLLAIPSDASGLYARSDSGEWRRVGLVDEADGDYGVWEMMFLPDGRGVAAGVNDLLLSGDGGKTWRRHRFGQALGDLAADPRGTVYVRGIVGVFALHRGAADWEEVPAPPEDACSLFEPGGQGVWACARQGGGVVMFGAAGPDAAPGGRGLGDRKVLALAAARDGSVFAGLEDGLVVSRDRGRTWQAVSLEDGDPPGAGEESPWP